MQWAGENDAAKHVDLKKIFLSRLQVFRKFKRIFHAFLGMLGGEQCISNLSVQKGFISLRLVFNQPLLDQYKIARSLKHVAANCSNKSTETFSTLLTVCKNISIALFISVLTNETFGIDESCDTASQNKLKIFPLHTIPNLFGTWERFL